MSNIREGGRKIVPTNSYSELYWNVKLAFPSTNQIAWNVYKVEYFGLEDFHYSDKSI